MNDKEIVRQLSDVNFPVEVERALIGCLFLENSIMDELLPKLKINDFSRSDHKLIYRVALELWSENKPIEPFTVFDRIKNIQRIGFEEKLDLFALTGFSQAIPSASNYNAYYDIVKEASRQRSLQFLKTIVDDPEFDSKKKIGFVTELVEGLDGHDNSFKRVSSWLPEVKESFRSMMKHKIIPGAVPCGIKSLDRILLGFHKSDLIILAARPSVGKTAMALHFARHSGTGVAFFSHEMSGHQLVARLACTEAGVNPQRIKTGVASQEELEKVGNAFFKLESLPIFVDDVAGMDCKTLKSKAKALCRKEEIGLVIVDYLQLVSGTGKHQTKNDEVAEVSRTLKCLAKEIDKPVIALAQLNRNSVKEKQRPDLQDLRDSGAIEQDADVVIMLWTEFEKKYDDKYDEFMVTAHPHEALIRKQRNGPVGIARYTFTHATNTILSY